MLFHSLFRSLGQGTPKRDAALGVFFNPPPTGETVFVVGDTQLIQWTTTYSNYTVALWQQSAAGGSATMGPILYQTLGNTITEFNWTVQLYGFHLAASNVFFFWLHPGQAQDQGNELVPTVPSSYFNITTSRDSVSSSSASSSSATSSSYSSSPSTSISIPTPSSGASQQSGGTTQQSSGLPSGALAGIGVGVAVAAIAAIFSAVLWFRYLKQKQKALVEKQSQNIPPQSPSVYYNTETSTMTPQPSLTVGKNAANHGRGIELSVPDSRGVVELA
ncbi:hypothetical protein QBC46DRAFT_396968 [Diplogelasinospora grovesii]|uniref:Mid2 domain-containing protein n=1 Tax=Diplogelasinospora grovesii TaxID=303347 RepID=A0AAN6S063_9PEZI|nr:hypothetical protein QBC46DRAFT_396968 [Diplogelasinospora grovesii]